jgi:tRNA(fMet)-specific endonuclease VapC
MKFLLDTNAWIEFLNHPQGHLAGKVAGHVPSEIALCTVTLAELLVGAYKSSQTAANLALVQQLVRQFSCLVFDEASADHYARLRAHLKRLEQPIGPYDMQIAGIALSYGLTAVTHNTTEFSRVPGLTVEDWLVP